MYSLISYLIPRIDEIQFHQKQIAPATKHQLRFNYNRSYVYSYKQTLLKTNYSQISIEATTNHNQKGIHTRDEERVLSCEGITAGWPTASPICLLLDEPWEIDWSPPIDRNNMFPRLLFRFDFNELDGTARTRGPRISIFPTATE